MKKKKVASKKREKTEKEEVKLSDIIKETEKEIEQDFFEEPVRQIPMPANVSAPVLERIIQAQAPVENPVEAEQPKEEKRIDYSPTTKSTYDFPEDAREDRERKYESNFIPPVLSRREMPLNAVRQEFLKPQTENWNNRMNESQLDEIEFIEREGKIPFEEEQKKYKRFKLR